jgi:hypothetical protein
LAAIELHNVHHKHEEEETLECREERRHNRHGDHEMSKYACRRPDHKRAFPQFQLLKMTAAYGVKGQIE